MTPGRFVAFYPRAWRERYGDELEDVLERDPPGARARIDLVRGAVDAHLHPAARSPLPVIAAVTASALATAHAIAWRSSRWQPSGRGTSTIRSC